MRWRRRWWRCQGRVEYECGRHHAYHFVINKFGHAKCRYVGFDIWHGGDSGKRRKQRDDIGNGFVDQHDGFFFGGSAFHVERVDANLAT